MTDIISLWKKATAINQKHMADFGKPVKYQDLIGYLGVSDRIAYSIYFMMNNRELLTTSQEIAVDKTDTELAMGDLHFPFQDNVAIDAMLNYAKPRNPSIITINGDLLDFFQISSFHKDKRKGKSVFEEIRQAREFLAMLREEFPDSRIVLYEGNHEQRMDRFICDKAQDIADLLDGLLQSHLQLKDMNIEYIDKPYRIGNLWHLHGHEKGAGAYNPEYICEVIWKYVYSHFVTFHYHRNQTKVFKGLGDHYWKTASVGYLAGEMDYSIMNKWQQGFAMIDYQSNGDFQLDVRTIIGGQVY